MSSSSVRYREPPLTGYGNRLQSPKKGHYSPPNWPELPGVRRVPLVLVPDLMHILLDHGSDPMSNPRLATLIASAKKVGFAKDSIENAIARGSGKPKDGKALENLSIEVIVPPSVGAVIDCRTDNMARTMQEIRTIVKDSGARISPTKHLFERRGRLIVSKPKALGSGALFDIAVEAGATDVELGNEESPVLYTEPEAISEVSARLSDSEHSLQVESAEMVWHPLEDTMTDDPGGNVLSNLLYQFHEVLGVQEVFLNVR